MNDIIVNGGFILSAVAVVLEVVMRLKPTEKNYSIIDNTLKVINFLVPNRKKDNDRFNIK